MATSAKANKTAAASATAAGTTETTGTTTGTLATQTDTGVKDVDTSSVVDSAGDTGSPGTGDAAGTDAGGAGAANSSDEGAAAPGAVASAGAPAADPPLGGDGVQAPATGDTGSSAFAPSSLPSLSQMVIDMREMHPDDLARLREQSKQLQAAFAELDSADEAAAVAALGSAPAPARAVVLFSAGAVHHPIGDLVEGSERLLASLAKSGDVDPHPDAVAAAEARGATVHQLGG